MELGSYNQFSYKNYRVSMINFRSRYSFAHIVILSAIRGFKCCPLKSTTNLALPLSLVFLRLKSMH